MTAMKAAMFFVVIMTGFGLGYFGAMLSCNWRNKRKQQEENKEWMEMIRRNE